MPKPGCVCRLPDVQATGPEIMIFVKRGLLIKALRYGLNMSASWIMPRPCDPRCARRKVSNSKPRPSTIKPMSHHGSWAFSFQKGSHQYDLIANLDPQPQFVSRPNGLLLAKWHDQDKRIAAYKEANITDIEAHDFFIRATHVAVCGDRLVPPVLHEWREPRHDAFESRNVWSLFNAFTESLKDGNLAELPKRSEVLHGLLDTHVGLSA